MKDIAELICLSDLKEVFVIKVNKMKSAND